jgi:hypothetical protein
MGYYLTIGVIYHIQLRRWSDGHGEPYPPIPWHGWFQSLDTIVELVTFPVCGALLLHMLRLARRGRIQNPIARYFFYQAIRFYQLIRQSKWASLLLAITSSSLFGYYVVTSVLRPGLRIDDALKIMLVVVVFVGGGVLLLAPALFIIRFILQTDEEPRY